MRGKNRLGVKMACKNEKCKNPDCDCDPCECTEENPCVHCVK